jgi:Domain of unknown function (DUF4124)
LHTLARHRPLWIAAALWIGLSATDAEATSNKVYRCTGANGKVTLSDRRCPEDDTAARPAAGPASATDSKPCVETRERLAERRKRKVASDAERKALRQLEDEQRRVCGA